MDYELSLKFQAVQVRSIVTHISHTLESFLPEQSLLCTVGKQKLLQNSSIKGTACQLSLSESQDPTEEEANMDSVLTARSNRDIPRPTYANDAIVNPVSIQYAYLLLLEAVW